MLAVSMLTILCMCSCETAKDDVNMWKYTTKWRGFIIYLILCRRCKPMCQLDITQKLQIIIVLRVVQWLSGLRHRCHHMHIQNPVQERYTIMVNSPHHLIFVLRLGLVKCTGYSQIILTYYLAQSLLEKKMYWKTMAID